MIADKLGFNMAEKGIYEKLQKKWSVSACIIIFETAELAKYELWWHEFEPCDCKTLVSI